MSEAESAPAAGDPAGELSAVGARMAEIKAFVTEELIRDWPSPWRNEAMTNAKVGGRLGGNKEFQGLLARKRELEKELGVVYEARKMEQSEDPMGAYVTKAAEAEKAAEEAAKR
ncbi:MAG: hypothetical protein ACT4OM_04385 [Actinomycetota bacterium]